VLLHTLHPDTALDWMRADQLVLDATYRGATAGVSHGVSL
jgi:hypothetical protein